MVDILPGTGDGDWWSGETITSTGSTGSTAESDRYARYELLRRCCSASTYACACESFVGSLNFADYEAVETASPDWLIRPIIP